MRPRVAVFSERLFAATHVGLGDLLSGLAARWELTLHAREVVPTSSRLPAVRAVPPLTGGALHDRISGASLVCWLADRAGTDLGRALARACRREAIPLLAGLGGSEVHELATNGPAAGSLREILEAARLVVVNTRAQRARLADHPCGDRLTVVPPGLPVDRYRRREVPSDEPFTVGFVGRLSPRKSVLAAWGAFARLHAEYPRSRFVAVGSGADRSALTRAVAASGLSPWCRLHETLTHARLLKLLATFSVLCCPAVVDERARSSGLPFILLESQAMGVPVVATGVGGTAEAIASGETGLLTASAAPEELGDALLRLARDPDLRRRLGRAGPAWVRRRFDLRKVIASYDVLCREVVGG